MDDKNTILLVDDVQNVRDSLGAVLMEEGYSVKLASNGVEAMNILSQSPIDLMVSDILMPEMDGVELVTNVIKLYPEIKLILISGGGNQPSSDHNYDYLRTSQKLTGINNLLKKPFYPKELIDMIQRLLSEQLTSTKI